MAYQIGWAESAIGSLFEAAEYVAKDSPSYASALTIQAEKAAESLHQFPHRGRLVPEYQDPEVRELFVGSYRLVYRVSENMVTVIAFVHGARDLAALINSGENNR